MLNSIDWGVLVVIGGAIVTMFIRIEHRLTKVETMISQHMKESHQCQPPLEDPTT